MKKVIMALVFSLVFAAYSQCFAEKKPRLGVLRFTNNTSAGWWSGNTGRDLQDMLVAELASTKSFKVLERKELDAVIKEQDLGASGRISKSTRSKVGKLTGAKYLVSATVSSFEEGASGSGAGISFGGFSLGGKNQRAYIAVDLKVINVETGEIADARTVEATSKSGGMSLGVYKWGLGGSLANEKKTPTGKAIRACIMEIAGYLECSLIEGANADCMDEYNEKERKRKAKTKGSIDLDE